MQLKGGKERYNDHSNKICEFKINIYCFLSFTKALELLQKELAYLDSDIERVTKLKDTVASIGI